MPVLTRGTSILPTAVTSFSLNNVLVAPALVHNLLSVRQFTRDNNCSIEFDASGFSVKYPLTRCVLLRCNSSGDLYTISPSFPSTAASCILVVPSTLWHHRLGHPGTCRSSHVPTQRDPCVMPVSLANTNVCPFCSFCYFSIHNVRTLCSHSL